MEKVRKNMKKGFSLVELVIVIVIMGILSAVVYNSLSGSKGNIEIQNSISSSVRQVTEAVSQYRANNSVTAEPYTGANINDASIYLPAAMSLGRNDGSEAVLGTSNLALDEVGSLGLNGQCEFSIAPDLDRAGGVANRGVKLFMDCSAMTNWTDAERLKAETVFISNVTKYSSSDVLAVPATTVLGLENVNFTLTGSNTDGIVGVRYFTN